MSIFTASITFAFVDDKGKTSSTKIRIPNTLSLAAISAFTLASAQVLADFSACQLTSARPCIGLDLSSATIRAIAGAGSDIAEKAWAIASTAFGTQSKMIMPTATDSYVLAGTDVIDETNLDVAAVVAVLEDGIVTTGGTIAPVDLRDNDLEAVDSFTEKFRKFTGR